MNAEQAAALRKPFPKDAIGKLPKGGTSLDYVGHAAVTDRLLSVDPEWVWLPDRNEFGRWDVQIVGNDAVLTGTLTVCGVTRPCVGVAPSKSFELHKQLQSDAIRNGAMRFGVALDLWSREDLGTRCVECGELIEQGQGVRRQGHPYHRSCVASGPDGPGVSGDSVRVTERAPEPASNSGIEEAAGPVGQAPAGPRRTPRVGSQ